MAEAQNDNINTTGADKAQRDAKNNAKRPEKVSKAANRAQSIAKQISKNPIILKILIIVLIVIVCIGIICFFVTLPGTYIENIKEFGQNLWANIVGYFTGEGVTASVTEEDQIELAQRIQDMGYDVVGYGFADARYEYDDTENSDSIDGYTNNKIVGISPLSNSTNYLQAYIAQSEATYCLSSWSLAGAVSEGGLVGVL